MKLTNRQKEIIRGLEPVSAFIMFRAEPLKNRNHSFFYINYVVRFHMETKGRLIWGDEKEHYEIFERKTLKALIERDVITLDSVLKLTDNRLRLTFVLTQDGIEELKNLKRQGT